MNEKYYVSGCVDNGLGVDHVEDSVAEFWSLYVRDASGESEALADFADRRSAEAAMAVYVEREALGEQVRALAADNASLNQAIGDISDAFETGVDGLLASAVDSAVNLETRATDAILSEVGAKARKEGAYFVANRMLAAWEAGFIEDTAENAADIARMILTATECMADAPEGDFDRSFADEVLQGIAARLRAGEVQP